MRANLGVTPGYFHQNNAQPDFYSCLQQTLAEVYDRTGIYVSCLAAPVQAIYHTAWGCPPGGERTYNIESTANPIFAPDLAAWKQAALLAVRLLKKTLGQTTATVQFYEVELDYLTDSKKND